MKAELQKGKKKWFYSDVVKEHFFKPKNLFKSEEEIKKFKADGVGTVGSAACGDVMEMWIKVKDNKIIDCRWKSFGCASAIATTSMLSVMVTENNGMKLEKALEIKPQDIIKRLEGLPPIKYHCSVLGDKALRAAINDYYKKTGQKDKIIEEGEKIIDKILKITDKDIEEAVLDGAHDFTAVQRKTKVGIEDKSCIPEVKQLIRYYREKHFGKIED